MVETVMAGVVLEKTDDHMAVHFEAGRKVLSSAVLNGGVVTADHVINIKVPKDMDIDEAPDVSLKQYAERYDWKGITVGMMTAASMNSFRMAKGAIGGVEIAVLVTCGLSNPRRVGDAADMTELICERVEAGTINLMVLTSATLTDAAMAEVLMMATEAKVAVLQESGVMSPVSGLLATGTGTDAIAVVSGNGSEVIQYAGKHVVFGEMIGRLVMAAVADTVNWDGNI